MIARNTIVMAAPTTVQAVASTDTTVAAPAPSGPDLPAVAGPEGKGGCHGLPRPRRDPHADQPSEGSG